MINVTCSKCGVALYEPGALVFGPPVDNKAEKMHICIGCWNSLRAWIDGTSSLKDIALDLMHHKQ